MLKARSLSLLTNLGLGLALLACQPSHESDAPSDAGPEPVASVEPERPSVDAKAMYAAIKWLASDDRQGRFTLAPEIELVATWLAERHAELGLEPVDGAESMRVAYQLRTKVEAGANQSLIVERRGKPTAVAAKQFIPRAEGISGTAKGEVVFVGYGLSWTRDPARDPARDEGSASADSSNASSLRVDSYDDLAEVDLSGKIALVFAHAPGTPDLMALFSAMRTIAEDFEASAAPLRKAKDLAKLETLHRKAREQLVDLVEPFVDTQDLGDTFWKVEDPKSGLDVMALARVFAEHSGERPQFNPREYRLSKKAERLAKAGAIGVIVVEGPHSFVGGEARKQAALPDVLGLPRGSEDDSHARVIPDPAPIPVVQLRWPEADKLFRVDGRKLSSVQAAIDGDYVPRSTALGLSAELRTEFDNVHQEVPNVLAQIPGESDEIIVIGAHFDHIGNDETGNCRAIVKRDDRDSVCNGADDNASGTAMLLELARTYQAAGIEPERTLVFAHFSGEELGLLGSRALMEDSPFDQSKVVAMINLDMVGRLGPQGLAIGGLYSSSAWLPLLDELGNYGMEILYEGATTSRSDHAWWFRQEIPVLFFFTGIHTDYHRAGDELDEINVEGLGSIGQLVSDVVWELASGRTVTWTDAPNGDGIGRGLPGSDPDTVVKHIDENGTPLADD